MNKVIKYTVLLLFFVPALFAVGAQNDSSAFITLSGNIFSDKTLSAGRYLIQNNLRVAKDATLTIEAGSELVFNPGSEIVILGGLKVIGRPNEFVSFYSLNSTDEGMGISFAGPNPVAAVHIEYAEFSGLIRPITFDNNWYRASVLIKNCQFKSINNNDAGILVGNAEHLKNTATIQFDFEGNIFADNLSCITFKALSAYNVQYNFTNNLIANNTVYDFKPRAKDNPLNGEMDADAEKKPISIVNNVFTGNYIFHEHSDTVLDMAGTGFDGTAKEIDITQNYWGKETNSEWVNKNTYGFHKDKFAPELKHTPYLTKPAAEVKAFITQITLDSGKNDPNKPVVDFIGKTITLHLSKPIAKNQKPVLFAAYLDTSLGKIFTQPLYDFDFTYSAGATEAKLLVKKVAGIEHGFYLVFSGLKDQEGFELPAASFGKFYLNRIFGLYKMNRKIDLEVFYANAFKWKTPPPTEGVIETVDPKLKELEKRAHSYELGLMLGVTNYFGDLSTNDFNRDEINDAYGIRFRYNYSRRISFRAMFNYGALSGNDRYSPSELRRERNLSFRSALYDFTIQAEYHLSHYIFSDKNRFIPSLSTGITVFHFNPKAQYQGKWYNLRDIGTEGQTSGNGKKYKLTQLALPVGFSFKTMLGYNFIAELEVNFVKTFTDYLDDVSGKFPNIAKVQAANSGTDPDAISHLIDPSGGRFTEGARRGKPENKDWYLLLGISLSYRF